MLRERVIGSLIFASFALVVFFLNQPLFYFALMLTFAVGIGEIWSASKSRLKSTAGCFFFFIVPSAYIFVSLVLVVGSLRWQIDAFWLVLAFLGTSAFDAFAYFTGKTFGKHKIAPQISPNKTWEGTLGGFLGPLLVAWIFGARFLSLTCLGVIVFAVMIGILAFLGDLLESWYKRKLGVKDMGSIIPGHGGLLDRIDSHLLVFLGMYFFCKLLI